jgi:hypothetical protein
LLGRRRRRGGAADRRRKRRGGEAEPPVVMRKIGEVTCSTQRVTGRALKTALCNNVDVVYFGRCNFVPFYKK